MEFSKFYLASVPPCHPHWSINAPHHSAHIIWEGTIHTTGAEFSYQIRVHIISKCPIPAIAKHEEASFRDLCKTLFNFEITNRIQSHEQILLPKIVLSMSEGTKKVVQLSQAEHAEIRMP